ncbi:MAG TPA: tetratricopeptide repeat protein [Candidatus Methanoperedens sp.]|nr:tetratricopeptide repeat protein [Candidatus Methanoperedens sp.]
MRRGLIGLLIAAATFAVFSRTGSNGFLFYDDAQYVVMNPNVAGGLSARGVRWAFTEFYAFNWHPLTWISHMLDRSLFGASPRGPHLVNAALHAASAALLFHVLAAMTGATGRAAFVAAAFALHPLHVQSVAWISERKDVLSAFFWFATLAAWLRHVRRPGAGSYLAAAGMFALGLLSKPMVVTLPLVLLLLDVWPLGRVRELPFGMLAAGGSAGRAPWHGVILEKLPLAALAAAGALLTFRAQAAGVAIHHEISLLLRAQNAVVSVIAYLGQAVWPFRLAVFYPYPAVGIPWWRVAGAALLLLAGTAAAVRWRRRAPWLATGWGWYLVMLLPVIGIVQVGNHSMADRYTYLPLTGAFIAAAWGAERLVRSRAGGRALAAASCTLLTAWAALTWVQIGYWHDDVALFTRALAVTPDNADARYHLGQPLLWEGRFAEAQQQLERAAALNPLDPHAFNDLGVALSRTGRRREAPAAFRRAIDLSPSYVDPYLNLGMAYLSLGNTAAARAVWRELQGVDPEAAARLARFVDAGAAR